jgi:hypothetical protein
MLWVGASFLLSSASEVTSHAEQELTRSSRAALVSHMRACQAWAMLWVGASCLLSSDHVRRTQGSIGSDSH